MFEERASKFITQFESLVREGRRVTMDSSAIIPLAENASDFLLRTIIPHPLFVVTPVVFKELVGLINRFHKLKAVVNSIVDLKKVGAPNPEDALQHEIAYRALIVLLPRKIAHELLITDDHSYVNQGIVIFEEGLTMLKRGYNVNDVLKRYLGQIQTLRAQFNDVGEQAKRRLLERGARLNVEFTGLDLNKYTSAVNGEAQRVHAEINIAMMDKGANLASLRDALLQFKTKTYTADTRHMAEVLAMDLRNITDDSDQLFLLEFHSRSG